MNKSMNSIPGWFSGIKLRMALIALPALILACFLTGSNAWTQTLEDMNIQERNAAKQARALGFGDLEIDNLHGEIADKLQRLSAFADQRPERKGSHLSFMKGRDSQNKRFFRIRIREGMSFSVEERPVRYLFRAHCFLYPSTDGKKLDQIIFQFYRINFSGSSYTRELRRIIHPNPIKVADLSALTSKTGDVKLLNNSKLTLQQYEELSTVKPVWEGPDGVPLPLVVGMKAREQIELHNPQDPIPFPKQVRIVNRYKKLLRLINADLGELVRGEELERKIRIEKILDFPG